MLFLNTFVCVFYLSIAIFSKIINASNVTIKKALTQSRLAKIYKACYDGNGKILSRIFDRYEPINLENAEHCISLTLINDDPLPVIKAVVDVFTEYIPLKSYHTLSMDAFSLLYSRFIDDWIANPSKIPAEILENEFVFPLLSQCGHISEIPESFANAALQFSLKFVNLDLAPKIQLDSTDICNLSSKVRDAASIEVLLSRRQRIFRWNRELFIKRLMESGSMPAYEYLLSLDYLSKSSPNFKERQSEVLMAILFSSNPVAIEVFTRFLKDTMLIDNLSDLADRFFDIDICKIAKRVNTPIFKKIATLVSSDPRWEPLVSKRHCFDMKSKLELNFFEDEDFKNLAQKYLKIDLKIDRKEKLEEKIQILSRINPNFTLIAFDGSENDPLNVSIKRIDIVKVLLDLLERSRQGESLINCLANEKPALFEGLEALPKSLYEQFQRVYTNYPRDLSSMVLYNQNQLIPNNIERPEVISPENYKLYHFSDPKVLFSLIGKNAACLDHLQIEVVFD